MTQRIIEIDSPNYIPEARLAAAGSIEGFFVNDNPLALEIGCGIGDFILQLAAKRTDLNFLAIDIYNKGCYKTCKKIDRAGLGNVRVIRIEARYLLARYLRPESLAAIYINCPDPWPKKRHRQRRLVNREFLQTALHYLRPGADLYFSSDFADYASQVADIHPTVPGLRNCLATPCETVPPEYPKSKYMRRFLERNQPIYFIHCRKAEAPAGNSLPVPPVTPGFRTPWSTVGHD